MPDANGQPYMLEGLRVLDFTQYLAGAGVTRMLAELGADITKVELPGIGDPGRLLPVLTEQGRGGFFIQHNRGKRSICVDWDHPEGRAVLHELAASADVIAENFATAETMARRGLAYEDVRAVNPSVLYLSVSCFGRTSPDTGKPGFDYIAQASSGLMHMNGEPDGPPMVVSAAVGDGVGAVHGFAALGYALYSRERTGRGQQIDIAMVDSLFHLQEFQVSAPQLSGGAVVPRRSGAHNAYGFPAGAFKGPEGWIVIQCLPLQWPRFCACIGRTDLLDDPRYQTFQQRADHRAELVPIVEGWLATFGSDREALDELERHQVPCAAVLEVQDAIGHPHYVARQMVRHVPDDVVGELPIPGFPFKFGAYPELPDLRAPELGQHTDEVLRSLLGRTDEEIARLHAAGAVHGPDTARTPPR